MPPQTRSTAKSTPGRSTRNSVYGRSPLPPIKGRNTSPVKSPVQNAPAHEQDKEVEVEEASNVGGTKGTPWLACRDAHGVFTTVAVSETGEGIHVRWYYPEDDSNADEDGDAEMAMTVDDERGATPTIALGLSNAVRSPFPQTPQAPQPFDAGSVIRTPLKRAKPLQPSPPRIGDKGVRCLFEKDGILRDFKGVARIVLRHPVGSAANLSREQVENLEREREFKIFQVQLGKLLDEKRRIEEERERTHFSDDSGYEDDTMETDDSSSQGGLQVSLEDMDNGAWPGQDGRQMLGCEESVLIHSAYGSPRRLKREKAFIIHSSEATWLRPRLGPEGTELID